MNGLAITHEHTGIHAAIDKVSKYGEIGYAADTVALAIDCSANPGHRVLGRVVDAFETPDGKFWVQMSVALEFLPGLAWLISSKRLGSISLTHMMDADGNVRPLEISLVSEPARPTCDIFYVCKSTMESAAYKARLLSGAFTMSEATAMITETPTPAIPTTVAEALHGIADPVSKNLIVARLQALVEFADAAKSETQEAKKVLAQQKRSAHVDVALLKTQLEQMYQSMDEGTRANFGLTDVDALKEKFLSGDPNDMLNAASNLIMCCNQSMMLERSGNLRESAAKRVRQTEAPAAVEIAPTPAVADREELLRRALFETFEM